MATMEEVGKIMVAVVEVEVEEVKVTMVHYRTHFLCLSRCSSSSSDDGYRGGGKVIVAERVAMEGVGEDMAVVEEVVIKMEEVEEVKVTVVRCCTHFTCLSHCSFDGEDGNYGGGSEGDGGREVGYGGGRGGYGNGKGIMLL